MTDDRELEKMSKFEERMGVVQRDNEDLATACRSVHKQLTLAKHVAESVWNDDVADNHEVVMSISSMIADELDEMNERKLDQEEQEEDDDYA
jgi:hypothetical protein